MRRACVLVLLFSATLGFGQQLTISGLVTDLNGRPVQGALITPAGGRTVLSNADGRFGGVQVTAPATLRVEAAGFYPERLEITSSAPVSISLTPRSVVREEMTVIAPRLAIASETNPAAIALVGAATIESQPRAVAADEALKAVPGVKVDNQANGERVHLSMRGQGILTGRGVRGIEVLLDDIPLNDPSGFVADLFDVDWSSVAEMRVVRGPVAFLYGGGSSGGVIDLRLREGEEITHGGLWSSGGSNGFYKTHADVGGRAGSLPCFLSLSRTAGDGYRQHTRFWGDNLIGKATLVNRPDFRLHALFLGTGYFNQNAEGLNLGWLAQDRRMANPDALTFNEYQKTMRFTGALSGDWRITAEQRLSFKFFARRTRYDEPVPSSVAHRSTAAPGGSAQYDVRGRAAGSRHQFSIGTDVDGQFADEHRHPNLGNAIEGDALLSNQSIRQSRFAGYAAEQVSLGERASLLLGVRFDRVANRLEDHAQAGGLNLSGERVFTRATGRAGVSWNAGKGVLLYTSWGQGFLPPATEELYANPAALGGFNMSLTPARSWGVEGGARGSVGTRVFFDASLFRLDTRDDFERYRMSNRPLETFYRNAGRSRRYGLETSLRWLPTSRITLSGAYTYSHFRYTQYDSFTYGSNLKGNWLPNSPAQQLQAEGTVDLRRGLLVTAETQAFSRAFVDATNVPFIDGYGLVNMRLSKNWQKGRTYGTVFVAGKNLTATRYIAFTEPDPDGNSYQPGPEREVFVGLQVRF